MDLIITWDIFRWLKATIRLISLEEVLNEIINERNTENLIINIQKKQKKLVKRKYEAFNIIIKINDKGNLYNSYKYKIDKVLSFKNFIE